MLGSCPGDECDDDVGGVFSRRRSDPEPVESEEHRESGALVAELFCGEEEPAEFGAVHPVALARMHLRAADVLCRVGTDPAVDVREPEEPPHPVHHRYHRGVPQPALTETADVQLDLGPLDPGQRA